MTSTGTLREFIAIDGDDVGNLLRDNIIANDIEGISAISDNITQYFEIIRSIIEKQGDKIIFCAGDSILASINLDSFLIGWLQKLPSGPCTISIGLGRTPEYAYLALQLAKARGKNQVVKIAEAETPTIFKWPQKR